MKSDNSFLAFLKSRGNAVKIAFVLLCAAVILFFALESGKTESGNAVSYSETEEKLAALCESVEGVGACRVMIAVKTAASASAYGTSSGANQTEICGITVVCEGGDNPEIAAKITDMLAAMYHIGTNRVKVLKLSS